MNLADLVEQFGSNDRCRDYLEHLRWPDGVECPRCASKSVSRIKTRKQFDCNSCRCRFSVLAGTIFQDSKLPLWKWFAAVYLVCESKKGISALQVKRMLKIGSYETAWYLCHRIRSAMQDDGSELLSGTVEADETYIGGKARGFENRRDAARGRMRNKTIVLGAIERNGWLKVRVAPDVKHDTIHEFPNDVVSDDAEAIYTDSHRSYRGIADDDMRHEYVD